VVIETLARAVRLRSAFFQLSWCFVSAVCITALLSGCDSKKSREPDAVATAGGRASEQHPRGGSPEPRLDDGHGHAVGPVVLPPAGPPAIALSPRVRVALTKVRVSAHIGSVLIWKEGNAWVMPGRDGCSVPLPRLERALDNLARLRAVSTNEPPPAGTAFQLQITLLIDEQRALHLEIADRNAEGDLVQLADASMVRLQGLDRALWSPHPGDWCRKP
jgi:hypothetical protein